MGLYPMGFGLKHIGARLTAAVAAAFLLALPLASAWAMSESVTLKQLKVDDAIYLPTVTSQRVLVFTKPKTWQLSGASKINVVFQHSHELLPNRSWLQVLVNDQQVYRTSLGPDNSKATAVSIPMPVGALKDQNTLTFRVEQHYTDKCEDPLDPSLWTQILPESNLSFDYTPAMPQVSLAQYPYPIIDPLTYSPQLLHYVVPQTPSIEALEALGLVNVHLAQAASAKQTRTGVSFAGQAVPSNSHLIYIGTPEDNPGIRPYLGLIESQTGYALSGSSWTNRQSGQALEGDAGLVLYVAHPVNKGRGLLILTGNTQRGVLQAARFVTSRPMDAAMKGVAVAVPSGWSPPGGQTAKTPRFIERQTRSLKELGFGLEMVEKINAPPITYTVPVVSNFRQSGARLFFDMIYSYGTTGSKINPEFSSLEILMNDVPIANVPLLQSLAGESMARATVPVPRDLIQPNNKLVAQYHLMPDKKGHCEDNYIDKAWGKIHEDSRLRVDGSPGSLLPNVGLLNYTAFPYSRTDNLKDTHFILPKTVTLGALQGYLGITSRLGRATFSDTDLRFSVSQGDNIPSQSKDLIVIQDLANPIKLPSGSRLNWLLDTPLLRQYAVKFADGGNPLQISFFENGMGSYLEQYLAPWSGERVVTVLAALNANGFFDLSRMLEDDERFAELTPGPLKQLAHTDLSLNSVEGGAIRMEKTAGPKGPNLGWFDWVTGLSWLSVLAAAFVVGLIIILLPVIIRRLRFRRY